MPYDYLTNRYTPDAGTSVPVSPVVPTTPTATPTSAPAQGMTYDQLIAAFQAKGSPGANGAAPHSAAWNDAYNRFIGPIMSAHGVNDSSQIQPDWVNSAATPTPLTSLSDADFINQISGVGNLEADPSSFNRLTALADAGNVQATKVLTDAGYENSTPTTNMPVEQGILQTALPGLIGDVEGDAKRRELAAQLTGQATGDYNAARDALSPEANAARLAAEQAQANKTGTAISDSAATSAAGQLKALQDSIAALQGNLTGDLAAKAAALQQQITSLNTNLDTLDASQKATLATQIAANQKDLEASISAQRDSLSQQLTSLRSGVDTQTAAQRAALQQELASLSDVNTQQAAARKAALQEQLATLNSTAGTQNQSKVAALQKEVDALTAAQAPMAQARLDSANALTTAVNLGLQSTNDQLTATQAKQGYLGGSTFDQAALARAAIGARQQGAQVLGSAREANAADLLAINAHGATQGRSLADELANNLAGISGQGAADNRSISDQLAASQAGVGNLGATGEAGIAGNDANAKLAITAQGAGDTRSLSDLLATGTRTIGDTGAAGNAAISGATATGKFNVGNTGAGQTYQDQVFGADQQKALADALAKGSGGIGTTLATQQQTARDNTTQALQGYFDNAYSRGQAGILARPGLASQLTGTLTGLENYGNTGLNRTLQSLNWWGTNTQAPTAGALAVSPDTSGNGISSLGANLLGSALKLGTSNNWWQTPSTAATTGTSAGDMNNYMDSFYNSK